MALLLYVVSATQSADWLLPINFLATAAVIAPLGYAVGRRQSAAAAGALVCVVLGLAILQFTSSGRTPSVIAVAMFAWIHGQAFLAARELVVLAGLDFGVVPAA